MSFHFKNRIIHQSQLVSDKVNFFADCFDFTLQNLGNPIFNTLENHKSLLQKIKFQLDNYTTFSHQYITHYFKNPYLFKNDRIVKEFYKSEVADIAKCKLNLFKDFSDSPKRELLLSSIELTIAQLEATLFQNALNKIIEAIMCKLPLERHNHIAIIEYYTPILVSEFMFAGFPKSDLEHLFDKILTKEVELKNEKVRTEAPLPKRIFEYKNDPNHDVNTYYSMIQDYLKNRNLKQQFEAIYDFYKYTSKEKTFLFKLKNAKSHATISIQYGEVLVSNTLKGKYVIRGKTHKQYRTFFYGKGSLFVEVKLNSNNDEIGKGRALIMATNAINYFNAALSAQASIDTSDFIIKDNDSNFRHKNSERFVYLKDQDNFIDHNALNLFSNRNKLTNKFIELDAVYFKALNAEVAQTKVVDLWRYLEAF